MKKDENYSVIDDTEFMDFKNILEAHGFWLDDFDLSEVDNTEGCSLEPREVRIMPLVGWAIVIRVSNGVTRRYKAGDNSAWVVDFQQDLLAGIYGGP